MPSWWPHPPTSSVPCPARGGARPSPLLTGSLMCNKPAWWLQPYSSVHPGPFPILAALGPQQPPQGQGLPCLSHAHPALGPVWEAVILRLRNGRADPVAQGTQPWLLGGWQSAQVPAPPARGDGGLAQPDADSAQHPALHHRQQLSQHRSPLPLTPQKARKAGKCCAGLTPGSGMGCGALPGKPDGIPGASPLLSL